MDSLDVLCFARDRSLIYKIYTYYPKAFKKIVKAIKEGFYNNKYIQFPDNDDHLKFQKKGSDVLIEYVTKGASQSLVSTKIESLQLGYSGAEYGMAQGRMRTDDNEVYQAVEENSSGTQNGLIDLESLLDDFYSK